MLESCCLQNQTKQTELNKNNHQTKVFQIIQKRKQPLKIKLLKGLCLQNIILKKFVFKPTKQQYRFPKKHYKIIKNQNSYLPFLYFPRLFPSSSSIIIYSHGNASNLNSIYQFAARLQHIYNVAVIAYDYSSYGQSLYQTVNFESDIQLMLAWALSLGYDIKRCILMGFSLGTYPTLYLKGMMARVLIAPISGILSFIQNQIAHYQGEIYDNIELGKQCRSRIFMIHSIDDTIGIQHSRILYKALINERSDLQKKKICYIETDELNHADMIDFFIRQQNFEFKRFLNQVAKDCQQMSVNNETGELVQILTRLKYQMIIG